MTDLERCDREIAEYAAQVDPPAWLSTLGILDWEMEKQMIESETA